MELALSVADKADTGATVGESTAIAAAHLTLWLGFLLSYLSGTKKSKPHKNIAVQSCNCAQRLGAAKLSP